MSDPTRLADPRSESPSSLRRLIDAGQSDLPDAARLQALAGRLGFGAGASPAGAAGGKAAATVAGGSAAKIGVVALLVFGAGAMALRDLARAPPELRTAASAKGSASPSAPRPGEPEIVVAGPSTVDLSLLPAAQPSSTTTASIARGVSSVRAAGAPPAAGTSPDEGPTEIWLLEQAQHALRDDARRALDLADQDATRYPSGSLAQEREVIAIEALVELGQASEARARATRFFQAFPGSAHGPRILALLGLDAGLHNP